METDVIDIEQLTLMFHELNCFSEGRRESTAILLLDFDANEFPRLLMPLKSALKEESSGSLSYRIQ